MAISLGAAAIARVSIGATPVAKVSVGNTLVWSAITVDDFQTGVVNWGSSISKAITVGAGGATVVVFATAISSATCAGNAMTLVDTIGSLSCYKYTFGSGDAGGSKTVVVSGGAWGHCMSMWALRGVSNVAVAAKATPSGNPVSFGPVSIAGGVRLLQAWAGYNQLAGGVGFSNPAGGTNRAMFNDGNRVAMSANEASADTTFTTNVTSGAADAMAVLVA